jgi:serpin B
MGTDRSRSILASSLALILVAGCAGATPSGSPGSTERPSVTPTPSLGPSGAPSPASPPPSPMLLAEGSLAITVTDDLRIRSAPEVSETSAKLTPLLPRGTELVILGGPVSASGYDWYHVEPLAFALDGGISDGWVASADHDGTPWLALAEEPLLGIELARSTVPRERADPEAAVTAAASINAFGLALYGQMLEDQELGPGNSVFSPTSIALALAMARGGARGDTASQMDAVLRASGWAELADGLNALDQVLGSHDATWADQEGLEHKLALRIANAAFGQQGWPIEADYLDAIAAAFGSGLQLLDYQADPEAARNAINGWVSRQTERRIRELLVKDIITEATRLVLVNAIYLKANWEIEFAKEETQTRSFSRLDRSTVAVPTMTLFGGQRVPYARGSGWQATELRYLGAGGSTPLAMTLVVPDDLAAFEAGLTADRLATITDTLARERSGLQAVSHLPGNVDGDCGTYPYEVELFMPRFGVDTGPVPLKTSLERLGMVDAFDFEAVDFSGIHVPADESDRIAIGQVIHQANIDVDEKGTEAAAATAVVFDTGGCTGPAPARTVTLRLDRPFLFYLRDLGSGAILFMGRVVDPSARS